MRAPRRRHRAPSSDRIRVPAVEAQIEPVGRVLTRARNRILVLSGVVTVALLAIGVRAATLCVTPNDEVVDRGSTQRWEQMVLRAHRGAIYDRSGDPLVVSVDTPTVVVDPDLLRELPSRERLSLARRVARVLDLPVEDVIQKMDRPGRYARVATKVHPRIASDILEIGNRAIFVESDQRRYYTEQQLASHVLGFVDDAGEGRSGIEAALDEYLSGTPVLMQRRRDRRGLDVDRLREFDRVSSAGMDVHLTLDRRIQHIAERALDGVMARHKPAAAMAVVLDPRTGDVLALANTPAYNPNALDGDEDARRNRAILDAIEPGSVLKPFVAAAALEEGRVELDTLVDCEGGTWRIGRARIGDDHPHDVITVSEIIKFSSNIGSAKLAFMLGAETYLDYLQRFGFGTATGVELPYERDGFVRPADTIKPIELATTSYGHGMTVTAVQLASAVATIGNGGVRMRPRLLSRVIDEDGVPARIVEPEVVDRVISESTARAVTQAMVSVTEQGGTATRAQVPGFRVAGKTGTAWKVEDGKYTNARIGSFIGFVPADDPALAIVVVVDDPREGSRYGGIVAAPAFAEIATHSLRHLGIEPSIEVPADAALDTRQAPFSTPVARAPLTVKEQGWVLPDLTGATMREALAALQGTGLTVELQGSGHLAAMEPRPGEQVAPGGAVRLTFN